VVFDEAAENRLAVPVPARRPERELQPHDDRHVRRSGASFDAMGNHDHSVNRPASMDSSTDPGCLAHEQELRDSGFLTDPDQPGPTVTAEDIHIGRKL
jgi:hypothetical protein